MGLLAAAKKHYRAYSLGMKQRLAIAASLLQPRELIILDEPTNGLDPQGTREVRALIREIATDGVTVLVSSHLLAEVEQICTHVGVMRTGRLVFQGTLEAMRARGAARVQVRTTDPGRRRSVLAPSWGWPTSRPATARSARRSATTRRKSCAATWCWPTFRWPASTRRGPAWRTCSWSSPGRASMSTAEAPPLPGGVAPARGRHGPARRGPAVAAAAALRAGPDLPAVAQPALLAVLVGIPVLLGIALRVSVPRRRSGQRRQRAGCGLPAQVAGNGVFLSFLALTIMLTLVLPLVVAVVSGETRWPGRRAPARCATCWWCRPGGPGC